MNEFVRIGAKTLPPDSRAAKLQRNLLPIDAIQPHLDTSGLIKGLFSTTSLVVLYGPSNVGKTFLGIDMALHMAGGSNWHGYRVTKPLRVLYLAAEGGRGTQNRVVAFKSQFPEVVQLASGNFTLLPMPVNLVDDWPHLLDALGFDPDCIFIDTLHQTFEGDENASRDMGAYIKAASQIKDRTNATVILIHHTGKDNTKGARGHSSLRAAMDTEIELSKSGDVINMAVTKQRDMRPAKPFAYQLREVLVGLDRDGDEVTSCVIEQCEPAQRKPKLTPKEKIALQALSDAMANSGCVRRENPMIAEVNTVTKDEFREMCKRHNLVYSDKGNSFNQAFNRTLGTLQEKQQIQCVDNFIWRVTEVTSSDSHPLSRGKHEGDKSDSSLKAVTSVTIPPDTNNFTGEDFQ